MSAEKNFEKGEKAIKKARDNMDKKKYKNAAKEIKKGFENFTKAALELLNKGSKKDSEPVKDSEKAREILIETENILTDVFKDENILPFLKLEKEELVSINEWIKLLNSWSDEFEEIMSDNVEKPVPTWAGLSMDSPRDKDARKWLSNYLDFIGVVFLGRRNITLFGVEAAGSYSEYEAGYLGFPFPRILKIEIPFNGDEKIVRGYDDFFKRRYLIGPPIRISNVNIDGVDKTLYLLPSKPHISDRRKKNSSVEEVIRFIPPNFWPEERRLTSSSARFEDDFGASEKLCEDLLKLSHRSQITREKLVARAISSEKAVRTEESTLKPQLMFCSNCGRSLQVDDVFCGKCGAKVAE